MSLSLLVLAAAAAHARLPAPEWSWAVIAEPIDVPTGADTALEVEHRIGGEASKPDAVSVAYWGVKTTTSRSDSLYSVKNRKDEHDLEGIALRYKFYPFRHTFFNFGAGGRTISTKETAEMADGTVIKADKGAKSVGLDLGVGNRWVFPNGFTIGGTWLDVFIPVAQMESHDAQVPDGYTTGNGFLSAAKKTNDGKTTTFRVAILDVGYAL